MVIDKLRSARWSRRTAGEEREVRRIERLLDKAEELLEDPERDGEVEELLRSLPPGPLAAPALHVRAADAWQELDQLRDAERHYRLALELDPDHSDALHGLGCVHQLEDAHAPMVAAWLRVRELDLADAKLPWGVSVEEFTAAAEAAFEELPAEIHTHLENLPIVVCDYPSAELIQDGVDPRSLGVITGVPFSHKRVLPDGPPELDCVQLYQLNIERIAQSREEVLEEVRITVLHETGHYFGLSDEDLDAMGLG